MPGMDNSLISYFNISLIPLEGEAYAYFFHVHVVSPCSSVQQVPWCYYMGSSVCATCQKCCTEPPLWAAKPALKIKYRRDIHILNQAQKVVWVLLPSASGLSERDPSTKCLAMPHAFGNLFWASVPTHIVEQSGIMSPWQSHQGRKRTAPNAHFIWDLKCWIIAASCPGCTVS